jgi:competence protein CoiA
MLRCVAEDNTTLYASNCEEVSIRSLSKEKKLFCPNCQSNVIFKKGKRISAHFAHHDSECVVSHSEPETTSHIKGKEILFDWIKLIFPTADIEYEVYIPETGQIADVFIKHNDQELEGLKWAFEFQHSPLSSEEWKKRHNLYESAGIQDFWFLDKAKYMKFSTAQGHSDARRRNDLEKTIFNETSLCYFLDIESSELTIDFEFGITWETRIIKRKRIETEYTYHRPIKHSIHMSQIKVRIIDNEFKHGVLLYNDVEKQMEASLSRILMRYRRKQELQLEREFEDRTIEKKSFAQSKFDEGKANVSSRFIDDNLEELASDIRNLLPYDFFEKYNDIIERIMLNLQTFNEMKESMDVSKKLLVQLNHSWDLNKMPFLLSQGSLPLEEYLTIKNKDKITLVRYAYEKYLDVFDKLSTRHPKITKRELSKIKWFLDPNGNNPTPIDYALVFHRCSTKEEIDMYINQILDDIINYNPFADMDDW